MKTIVVTGAGRGLGLAISTLLLSSGYEVIGVSRTLSKEAQETIGTHPHFHFKPFDLSQIDQIATFCRSLTQEFKGIYGLINNAAVGKDGILSTMHDSEIQNVINLNVTSTLLMTKYLVRPMMLKNKGRVICISSIIAQTGFSGLSVYAASKAALIGFTKSLSRELGRVNITVNAVSPGYMKTEMTSGIAPDDLNKILRRSPLNRLAEPQEVAEIVQFLLSEKAASITGSVFTVDAGSTA